MFAESCALVRAGGTHFSDYAPYAHALRYLTPLAPAILGWLAIWGLITALARPLSLGFFSYPEVLLRASHVLAPLAVALLLSAPRRTRIAPPD